MFTFIHIRKSRVYSRVVVLGFEVWSRGDPAAVADFKNMGEASWFIIDTAQVNMRTRKRTVVWVYKTLLCGRPTTRDIATGYKEELTTGDGHWVVQPAERITTWPRFAKPVVDPRPLYFIHKHPFDTSNSLMASRSVEGVVGKTPIDATTTFISLLRLTEEMGRELRALSVTESE